MRYACLLISVVASVAAGCATPPSAVEFHDWTSQSIAKAPAADAVPEKRLAVAQESITHQN